MRERMQKGPEGKRNFWFSLIKINGRSIDLWSWIDSSLGNFFPLILSAQTIGIAIFYARKESNELPKLHLIFIVFIHCSNIFQHSCLSNIVNDVALNLDAIFHVHLRLNAFSLATSNRMDEIKWKWFEMANWVWNCKWFKRVENALRCPILFEMVWNFTRERGHWHCRNYHFILQHQWISSIIPKTPNNLWKNSENPTKTKKYQLTLKGPEQIKNITKP